MPVASLIFYLIGSLNTAILLGRLRGIDIRSVGTRNAGAQNVWVSIGKREGFIVGAVDVMKGFGAAWFGTQMGTPIMPIIAVIAGHNWPLFFGLTGGKGVATMMGALVWLSPFTAAVGFFLMIGCGIMRISGAAPFVALASIFFTRWGTHPNIIAASSAMGLILIGKRVQAHWQELKTIPDKKSALWRLFLYDGFRRPSKSFFDIILG